AELDKELEEKGIEALYNELSEIDPAAAERIHPNNTVRVLRALEVYRTTGTTITEQAEQSHVVESDIEPLYIGITYNDREMLYDRINKRVDVMVDNGLVDEARDVFSKDISKTAFNSIGCKEIKPYIDGVSTLSECLDKLKMSTRRYAKRQLTWFRRNERINWVYPDIMQDNLYNEFDKLINSYLAGDEVGEKT
ncbi:MAG: tRNA (adenosine(37)-N6)-dimethylallyltransferase MiaA, partial [Clostridia bacterium]|nr:tRNA (adenosine(37)-N6)-dimethylallyltransferase MiaA [Clostridia bacterium]